MRPSTADILTEIKTLKPELEWYKNRRAQLWQQLSATEEKIRKLEDHIQQLADLPAKLEEHEDEHPNLQIPHTE